MGDWVDSPVKLPEKKLNVKSLKKKRKENLKAIGTM